MRDLSLHLLDLAQNSVKAGAGLVSICLQVDEAGWLTMTLKDDGCGMSPELLQRVTSPFATTRTTRKVGLGIPMMMENAQRAGGSLHIESEAGRGTTLTVNYDTRNIDSLPLGDLPGTILSLVLMNPDRPDFLFQGKTPKGEGSFDTREIRAALAGVPLNEPEVTAWMKDALNETINPIFGGV